MKYLKEFINYLKQERNYSELTIDNYTLDIVDYLNFCDNNDIDIFNIDYEDVRLYLKELNKKRYKGTTLSRKLSSIRAFYNYLYDKSLVKRNMFKGLGNPKKEKKLPRYMDNNDIECVFNIPNIEYPIGQRNRLILELLYSTGVRVSELCNIKVSDIDYSSKTIKIIGKGRKDRVVYYGSKCEEILNMYLHDGRVKLLNGKYSEYLIIGTYKTSALTTRSVELIINDIVTKAALNKKVSPHVFRHTFATHLLNEGCDILVVKELLGHSSLDTTGIYTHISNERVRNVYLNSHPRARKNTKY